MSIARQIVRIQAPKPERPFEKIKTGLIEALAVAKGEAEPAAVHVRRGRKPSGSAKKLLTLRLDQDVIDHYRATGEGWQSRMSDVLRKGAGL
jgi:uncharacterized protein (DUF4415 family)